MRVAFVSQMPFALDAGGLGLQVRATADGLRAVGVQVEMFDPWKAIFDADLLHCFGSDYQVAEIASRAAAKGIPLVVSAVFAPRHPEHFYAAWRIADRLVPMKTSFRARAQVLRAADVVIALTSVEAEFLTRFFGTNPAKIRVIPNGVESRFFSATAQAFSDAYGMRDFALMVASVEPLKNQLRLVQAAEGTGVPLVMIGAPAAHEKPYAAKLARTVEGRDEILWIAGLPHESPVLASAYSAARVHALPSLVEAQGIATLEAVAAGANIVVSALPAIREAFGAFAWYCDPTSIESIREALMAAYRAPRGERYAGQPGWLVSWSDVAVRLAKVYSAVLQRPNGVRS